MRAPAWAVAFVLAIAACDSAWAEQNSNGDGPGRGGPVYQRHASGSSPMRGGGHDSPPPQAPPVHMMSMQTPQVGGPQVNAGWFQRPYPYHLDYYRMRYGGSYAPYFGNLYGTPQVVNYPPYYGPYYGGYGGGYANGYAQPGYGGVPMEYPANSGVMMPGAGDEESVPAKTQTGELPVKAGGEVLPAPTP